MAEKNQEKPAPRRSRKKPKGHAAHHGGAWKVAYADFVTAMMALFLVLWLVSQADTELKEALANYFRSPGVFDTIDGGVLSKSTDVSKDPAILSSKDDEVSLFSVAQSLQEKFSTRPEFAKYKDKVQIDVTDEGLRIQLIDKADSVSFPSGSSELTEEARMILTEIANDICNLPNKINIGGHTDSYVFPTEKGYSNWELSTDRANAARRLLESVCVKPSQIHRIVGFADTEPLVSGNPFAPANRRISITVLRLSVSEQSEDQNVTNEINPAVNNENTSKVSRNDINSAERKVNGQTTEISAGEKPEEIDEKEKIRKKLLEEGAVKIGESDELPDIPVIKQTQSPK
jgi:chemotaxis protein MotB